jgi:hypothetical protein
MNEAPSCGDLGQSRKVDQFQKREKRSWWLWDFAFPSNLAESDIPSRRQSAYLHMSVDGRPTFPNSGSNRTITTKVVDKFTSIHKQKLIRNYRIGNDPTEVSRKNFVTLRLTDMEHFEKERLCQTLTVTPEAIHIRLEAVRQATDFNAKELALSAGIKYTTFKSQEWAGKPSLKLLEFYWRAFQIDPNFILGGDFSRVRPDTLKEILKHLVERGTNSVEREPS